MGVMDWETADGSQLSLREIWTEEHDRQVFRYTSVTAVVDGRAYAGRLDKYIAKVDDGEVAECLEVVPPENIYPLFLDGSTLAPTFRDSEYYLKAPSFTYEDSKPGNTFVAECLIDEIVVLEKLSQDPHPNIVQYLGYVVRDGRVSHLCLRKYACSLAEYAEVERTRGEKDRLLDGIEAALSYLHSRAMAHNDLNPDNVCVDADGNAILIDFDSCLPFGENTRKGTAETAGPVPKSSPENDHRGFGDIEDWLYQSDCRHQSHYQTDR